MKIVLPRDAKKCIGVPIVAKKVLGPLSDKVTVVLDLEVECSSGHGILLAPHEELYQNGGLACIVLPTVITQDKDPVVVLSVASLRRLYKSQYVEREKDGRLSLKTGVPIVRAYPIVMY